MRQGGRLEQYDTPAAILGAPGTDFVAEFVGADRGLKRLSVTGISTADIVHPPVVSVDDTLAAARAALDAVTARWAVVLDANGHLHGWLAREHADGDGDVYSRGRRMAAWVPLDA